MEVHVQPEKSVLVVGVQRSGTALLCEAISLVGTAGIPSECFLEMAEPSWTNNRTATDIRAYLTNAYANGTTSNGVFGAKIMWNTFCTFVDVTRQLPELSSLSLGELTDELFGETTCVWIRRKNKIEQAVSWAMAAQTGRFTSLQADSATNSAPQFDFTLIDSLHQLILDGERGWNDYFRTHQKKHIDVFYEDLVDNLDASIESVFAGCELEKRRRVTLDEIKYQKQADATNYEWVESYVLESSRR